MSSHTPDTKALTAKQGSLVEEVSKLLDERDAHLAPRLVEAFCALTPPQDPPIVFHLLTARSGGLRGGETRKPGNIRFNWRKLYQELGDMILNAAGAIAVPVLIPFAALSLWNKFWTHATIPLSREQATAIFAMWHRKDANHKIAKPRALEEINALLVVFKLPPLDEAELEVILRDLAALECVEVAADGEIWLREWVSASYS
jgi:hypothetical protein